MPNLGVIMLNLGVLMNALYFVVGMVNATRQIDKCYNLLLVHRNNSDVYEGKKTKIQHNSVIFWCIIQCQVHEHSLYT